MVWAYSYVRLIFMIPIESRKGNFKNLIEELLYYEMTNADLLLNHRTLTFEAENILLVIHLDDISSYLIFTRRQRFLNALVR